MLSIALDQLKSKLPTTWTGTHDCGTKEPSSKGNSQDISSSSDEIIKLSTKSTNTTTDEIVPIPKDMDELVKYIRAELGIYGLDSDKVDVNKIMKLMDNYQSNSKDWEKYAHFDPNKYTRNLVDDGNGEFNLLVLAWGEGQRSPIHDHAGSHCVMKILDGELEESLYEWPDKTSTAMTNTRTTIYQRDQTTYMSDKLGLHRVGNPTSRGALSLHLYTPPITHSITFQESTAKPRSAGACGFYSIRGDKV